MSAAKSLDALRREIDRIDEQIHDLIRRRTEVVESVRDLKKGDAIKIRPAREDQIAYRLIAEHTGNFPKRELLRIWRELIVATLSFEGPFSVAVYEDDPATGCWDLARDMYGTYTPMAVFPVGTAGHRGGPCAGGDGRDSAAAAQGRCRALVAAPHRRGRRIPPGLSPACRLPGRVTAAALSPRPWPYVPSFVSRPEGTGRCWQSRPRSRPASRASPRLSPLPVCPRSKSVLGASRGRAGPGSTSPNSTVSSRRRIAASNVHHRRPRCHGQPDRRHRILRHSIVRGGTGSHAGRQETA